MKLIRLIIVLPMLVAACGGSSSASEPDAPSCEAGDYACALIQVDDIGYLFGDMATFTSSAPESTLEAADWCGVKIPAPTVTHSLVLEGTIESDNAKFSIVSNVHRFVPGQAEEFLLAVGSLPQGCDWIEGGVRFQYLDRIDPRLFADESSGGLFKVWTGESSHNIQIFWLRQGDVVQSVAFAPSLSSTELIDAILDVANQKLQDVTA